MKVAPLVASSLVAVLATANAQVATTVNRVHTTYLGEGTGYGLGGFSYQPFGHQTIATSGSYQPSTLYHAASFYQNQQPFQSTAVLTSPVQTSVAATPLISQLQPVFHSIQHAPVVQSVVHPVVQHIAAVPQTVQHQAVQYVQTQSAPVVTHSTVVPTQVRHAISQPVSVSHSTRVAQPVIERQGDTQVLRFQPDHQNEFRLLNRDEPPHIEQVTIKDPKVTVLDFNRQGEPPMKLFQVTRMPSPPTTIEFVSDVPNETQVTVLDDDQPSRRIDDEDEPLEQRDEEKRVKEIERVLQPRRVAAQLPQIPRRPPQVRSRFGDRLVSNGASRLNSERRDFTQSRRRYGSSSSYQ